MNIEEWKGAEELEYVKRNEKSIFLMPPGMMGTLLALWDIFPLLSNYGRSQSVNIAFPKKHMQA